MEVKGILKRTQSLRSVNVERPPVTLTGMGRERKTSVSQLVAQYRFSESGQISISQHVKQKTSPTRLPAPAPAQVNAPESDSDTEAIPEPEPGPVLEPEPPVPVVRTTGVRERSRSLCERPPLPLSRAKSMESLPRSSSSGGASGGGTSALRALFESKVSTPRELKSWAGTPSMPLVNGDAHMGKQGANEDTKEEYEHEQEVEHITHNASAYRSEEEEVTPKAARRTRSERRKTITGVPDWTNQTSEEREKRRSIADFRDSDFLHVREKPSVSVRAMSARYQSKVAADGSGRPLKQEMDSSSPSGNRPKAIKLTEDPRASKSDISVAHLPKKPLQRAGNSPQAQTANLPQNPTQPQCHSPVSPPPSKEAVSALHQQRQKCELKRIMKHTCPELSSLDRAVDAELAEVWDSEKAAADTGYQGEVLSRRWIFENCPPQQDNMGDPADSKAQSGGGVGPGRALGGPLKRAPPPRPPPPRPPPQMVRPQPDGSPGTVPVQMEGPLNQSQSQSSVLLPEVVSEDQTDSNNVEEEIIRADVRATRMMFESQNIPKRTDSPENASPMKVVVADEERGSVKKKLRVFNSNKQFSCDKTKPVPDNTQVAPVTVESAADAQQDETEVYMGISNIKNVFEKKSAGQPPLRFKASGYIPNKHIEVKNQKAGAEKRQSGHIAVQHTPASQESVTAEEEQQKANVKDRAQLFESTPFHTINRKEGADVVDTSMNERLKSLFQFNAIQGHGTIIESFEADTAKKATYNFTKGCCPEVLVEDVITGNIKNILLQILPRAKLIPSVNIIKEDEQGNVEVKNMEVPIQQLPFTAHQEKECSMVNLIQVVEDLLSMDNSLQKGVIIQQTPQKGIQASVYSLFSHGDIKGVQEEKMETASPEEVEEEVKGDVKGAIRSLMAGSQGNTNPGPHKVDRSVRGNVKLFMKCIEKGDLQYLKSLQKTPSEEDLSSPSEEGKGQIVEETEVEFVPGTVKNIKSLFCQPSSVPTPNYDYSKRAPTFQKANSVSNSVVKCPAGEPTSKSTTDEINSSVPCDKLPAVPVQDQPTISSTTSDETQNEERPPRTDLVEAVQGDLDNLEAAILSLQEATLEAKALQHSLQEKQGAKEKHKKIFITERDDVADQDHVFLSQPQQPDNSLPVSPSYYSVAKSNPPSLPSRPPVGPGGFPVQVQHAVTPAYKSESLAPTKEKRGPTMESKTLDNQAEDKWETDDSPEESDVVIIKKGHLQETIRSLQNSSSDPPSQEEKEEIVKGSVHAALQSLGQSNFNTSQGDFTAAQIYRDAGKSYEQKKKAKNVEHVIQPSEESVFPTKDSSTHSFVTPVTPAKDSLTPKEQKKEAKNVEDAGKSSSESVIPAKESSSPNVTNPMVPAKDSSTPNESNPVDQKVPQEEEIIKSSVQSALQSLGQSSFNITQGDYTAAMVYKNAGKSNEQRKKAKNVEHVSQTSDETVSMAKDSSTPNVMTPVTPVTQAKESANSNVVTPEKDSSTPDVATPVTAVKDSSPLNAVTPVNPAKDKLSTLSDQKKAKNAEHVVKSSDESVSLAKNSLTPNAVTPVTPAKDSLTPNIMTPAKDSLTLNVMTPVTPTKDSLTQNESDRVDQKIPSLASDKDSVVAAQSNQSTPETATCINSPQIPTSKRSKKKGKKSGIPKPAIPPKPDHLKKQPVNEDKEGMSLPSVPIEKQVVLDTCKDLETEQQPEVHVVQKPVKDEDNMSIAAKSAEIHDDQHVALDTNKDIETDSKQQGEPHLEAKPVKNEEESMSIASKTVKESNEKKAVVDICKDTDNEKKEGESKLKAKSENKVEENVPIAPKTGKKKKKKRSVVGTSKDLETEKNKGQTTKSADKDEQSILVASKTIEQEDKKQVVLETSKDLGTEKKKAESNVEAKPVHKSEESTSVAAISIGKEDKRHVVVKTSKDQTEMKKEEESNVEAKPVVNKVEESPSIVPNITEKHDNKQGVLDTSKTLDTKHKQQVQSPVSPEPFSYKDALCRGMTNSSHSKVAAGLQNTVIPETQQTEQHEGEKSDSSERHDNVQQATSGGQDKHHMISNPREDNAVSKQDAREVLSSYQEVQVVSTVSTAMISSEFVSGFQAELQNCAPTEQSTNKARPVKPKRMKMAKDTTTDAKELPPPQQCSVSEHGPDPKECKVIMREKKVRKESEDERIQRLSVHRDEIMRGNVTAAMEIFDNLRKQEELKSILSKVEEVEQDTSDVDVKALKKIFENVPDWIRVKPKKLRPKQTKVDLLPEEKCESPTKGPEMSSMELAFGDLEKASAEILNLKEQTLTKLLDIEEAIRKALLSVSTLKSESDIAGLSGLLKESMTSTEAPHSPSNISKISIGSSKKSSGKKKKGAHANQSQKPPVVPEERPVQELNVPVTKPRTGSPSSSPTYISIQSGVRKESESSVLCETQASASEQHISQSERFQSTKDLIVNGGRAQESMMSNKKSECTYVTKALSAMDNPFDQCQFNVLEVQTLPKGQRVTEKKILKEDCEKTDCFGNRYFSSKTVLTTQPETRTSSKSKTVTSAMRSEVKAYPKANLPSFREDRPPV